MAYLIHFNKNHSPKNGQFTSGDGDADGVRDDHHNYKKNKVTNPDGKGVSVKTETKKNDEYEVEKTVISKTTGNKKAVDDLVEDFNKNTEYDVPYKNLDEYISANKKYYKEKYGIKYEFSPSDIGDFSKADKMFDTIAAIGADIYDQTKDINKAVKYITDNIDDVPYKIIMEKTKYLNEGYDYVTFYLEAYGDKYMYGTSGEPQYSDEQYFDFNKNNS